MVFKIKSLLARQALAEFIGTFILVVIGDGAIAQHTLSHETTGVFLSIDWAWGMAICASGLFAGKVSGHINPAMSLAQAILGNINLQQLIVFVLAQYLGAFVAAAVVYGVYIDALNEYDGGVRHVLGENKTAGIWATYPAPYLSPGIGVVDQIVGTAYLVGCAMAIEDERNQLPQNGVKQFLIGLVVVGGVISYGCNYGFAVNPARDLGPRVFTLIAGWGTETFSHGGYKYFWIPILGPHIGAIVGAFTYLLFIGNHWPDEPEDKVVDETEVYVNEGFQDQEGDHGISYIGKVSIKPLDAGL